MNRVDSIARVSSLGAVDRRPTLTAPEVGAVVDAHPITDSAGRGSGTTDWDPTYDVNAATAEVWRIKAGRVAGDYSFTADDASFSKGDVLAHCLEMEAKYAAMAGSPSGVGVSNAGTLLVGSSVYGYLPRTYIDWASVVDGVLP